MQAELDIYEFCKATATEELATAFARKHRLLLSNAQVQQQQQHQHFKLAWPTIPTKQSTTKKTSWTRLLVPTPGV